MELGYDLRAVKYILSLSFSTPTCLYLHSIIFFSDSFLPKMLLENGSLSLSSYHSRYFWYNNVRPVLTILSLVQDPIWLIINRMGLGSWSRIISFFILVLGISCDLKSERS